MRNIGTEVIKLKKYTSVFGLFAKSSILKILLVISIMAAVQVLVFTSGFGKSIDAYEAGLTFPHVETLIGRSRLDVICGAAFLAVSVMLCLPGTSFSSKTGYTLDRLSVSQRAVFFCQAIYNLFIYFILFAAELAVCFGLCAYYAKNAPEELVGDQSIFLAFYRNSFLHALLPLSDVMVWVRNGFLLLALAIATAEYPYKQRHKKLGFSAIAMVLFTVVFFKTDIVNSFNTILIIVVSVINVIEMCYNFFSEDNSYEREA